MLKNKLTKDIILLDSYDIVLKRVEYEDIELIRKWRNDPKISQYLYFRGYITSEMQERWFQKINNKNNYYFIILQGKEKIGLTEIKNIDYKNLNGEAGIFLYAEVEKNSFIGYRALLNLYDFVFLKLELKKIYIHILSDNIRSIHFHKNFGFENIESEKYLLTRERYFIYAEKIINSKKIFQ